ncbi:GH3 auxin-responsive promoter family protein [Opitutus sp. ER46]|uniref:GH3 family domain-containing protein n=1 Tax=Opitutus sp. ER46 TaxID=2161864 RepID=UPI001304980C|nr:GH3 auxin-responsive promoter family protein [Opitutus sp. ER46]
MIAFTGHRSCGLGAPPPAWLQRTVAWGAMARTRRVDRRLALPDYQRRAQAEAFATLMAGFGGTSFGAVCGLDRSTTYREFRTRVAPRTYEDLAPWIERMKAGEPDVLWRGRCSLYAVSSGTTHGPTKYLPVTPAMLRHFRHAGLDSLGFYARRAGSGSVFAGRQLFLGGSTQLAQISGTGNFAAWAGDLSGITAQNLPGWAERFLYEPGRDIAQIADWPAKLAAIGQRTATRDVRLLAGIPSWILIFAEVMRQTTGRDTLRSIWPNLECLVHGGVPIGPFVSELRAALGPEVRFHEVYPASEGFIAAQDLEPEAGLRLLVDAGLFFEFVPLAELQTSGPAGVGAAVVPLEDVVTGVDYALLLTTPGGLCRYLIGDVVRFVSTQPARLVYAGRTALQLSAFGEHVIEKDLTDALTRVMTRIGACVANFHVAPLFANAAAGVRRGRHEWWVELKSEPKEGASCEQLAAELDHELQRANDDYLAKRQGGGLDGPVVRLVPAGTFERWMREQGKWGGQHKMPRCRSDRTIVEQLSRGAFR